MKDEIQRMREIVVKLDTMGKELIDSGIIGYGFDENLAIYRRPPKSLSSNKLIAIERIWFLYRNIANLSVPESLFYFGGWALRATLRRL